MLCSCKEVTIFVDNHIMDNEIWDKNSNIAFEIEVKHPGEYTVDFLLQYTSKFPFTNLWTTLNVCDSIYCSILKDTVNFKLDNSFPQAFGNEQTFKNHKLHSSKVYKLNKGKTHFIFEHQMQDTLLKGIRNIGIIIKKYGEE